MHQVDYPKNGFVSILQRVKGHFDGKPGTFLFFAYVAVKRKREMSPLAQDALCTLCSNPSATHSVTIEEPP